MNFPRGGRAYRKSDLASHSLFLMLLLPCFLTPEASSIVMLGIFTSSLFLSKLRIDKSFFLLVAPMLALLFVGSTNAAFNNTIGVFKDIWYVGQVAVAIGAGFVLARYKADLSRALKVVVLAGAVAAFVHMLDILLHWQAGMSIFDLRKEERIKGYFISVIALSLIVTLPKSMLRLRPSLYFLLAAFCIASLVVSFSRTYIISLFVMVFILKGWAAFRLINLVKAGTALALLVLVMVQASINADGGFLDKFVNSLDEVSVEEYSDKSDIALHWRGYESYRALVDFKEGNVFQQIFGQGLGATIDLGLYMKLGDAEFRYIPVLHNGYLYVLVKFGLLGLLIYIYFLMKMIMRIPYIGVQRSGQVMYSVPSYLIASMGWVLILTTLVIAGPFNKTAMVPVLNLTGFLSGFMVSNKNLHP